MAGQLEMQTASLEAAAAPCVHGAILVREALPKRRRTPLAGNVGAAQRLYRGCLGGEVNGLKNSQ